jgi:toxin ParE1/3/4
MKVTLHPAAEQDVHGAAAFYEREGSPIVAARFVAEFKRLATLLLEHPEIGSPRSSGRRGFPMRVFPYTVVYRVIADRHQDPRRQTRQQASRVWQTARVAPAYVPLSASSHSTANHRFGFVHTFPGLNPARAASAWKPSTVYLCECSVCSVSPSLNE